MPQKLKKPSFKKIKEKRVFLMTSVLIIALLNYVTSLLVQKFNLPIFLDTWATVLGVVLRGLGMGLTGGVLYNLLMALTVRSFSAWIWSFSSAWVALAVWFFKKKKWLDIEKPFKILSSGVLIGLSNGLLTSIISIIAFKGVETYEPIKPLYDLLLSWINYPVIATLITHFLIEILDKSIVLFMAVIIVWLTQEKLVLKKK